jgi:hypothetical protein
MIHFETFAITTSCCLLITLIIEQKKKLNKIEQKINQEKLLLINQNTRKQLEEDRKEMEQLYRRKNSTTTTTISNIYNGNVRHLHNDSKGICRDWTKSNCGSAAELIPFLEKYKKIRVEKKNGIKPKPKDLEDFYVLEEYREKEIHFWNEVMKGGYSLNHFCYPGFNELKSFSTFHWAIYMSNLQDEPEPELYEWVMKNSIDKKNAGAHRDEIECYRETLKKEFPRIQGENSEKK